MAPQEGKWCASTVACFVWFVGVACGVGGGGCGVAVSGFGLGYVGLVGGGWMDGSVGGVVVVDVVAVVVVW